MASGERSVGDIGWWNESQNAKSLRVGRSRLCQSGLKVVGAHVASMFHLRLICTMERRSVEAKRKCICVQIISKERSDSAETSIINTDKF